MLIGSQYSDNKIYRGIRHYDSLPLSSEDMHEYSDTVFMKNAYIMNNIIGQGTLNAPTVGMIPGGLRLSEPIVLIIDGDVSLIQSDDNTPIVDYSNISRAGVQDGVVCLVGWYQHLLSSSTLRNYGGVDNSIIENNLLDNKLGIQLSTRYQFRWTTVLLDRLSMSSSLITFELPDRDQSGDLIGTTSTISATPLSGSVFSAGRPDSMMYAESDLYIVPIIEYTYDVSSYAVTGAKSSNPIAAKGGSHFINSSTEPTGEYPEGTTWYNPDTREFKTYVADIGFVDSASKMGFLQYQSIYEITGDILTPQDITVPVGISSLEEGDILQVNYEGLILIVGEHYSVDYSDNSIKLLDFTVHEGDKVIFTSTKIVEATDITNIALTFSNHIRATGSDTIEAHVRLSDTIDERLGVSSGIAATPKAVYDATLMIDPVTGKKYKFGVSNSLLYLEEV